VFAAACWALLKSYRDLNSAKFENILSMEARRPIRVDGDEWIASAGRRSSSACAGTP
ncbi:MAG: RipA family octameric membrane protein, partial [Thermoleophilaceae bacterium]